MTQLKRPKETLAIFLVFIAIIIRVIFRVWGFLFDEIPEVSLDTLTDIPQKTTIVDRDGNLLYTFFEEDREYTQYQDIPDYVTMAFLSSEDRNYREHNGIDARGIVRAVINNAQRSLGGKNNLQWASTISQQLVKNMYLSSDRTLKRKLQEVVVTRKMYRLLDSHYTKNNPNLSGEETDILVKRKIIELYMNLIFLGNNSYGINTAARHYYDKNLQELTLLESAILWWIPKAPTTYNPLINYENTMWDWQLSDGEEVFMASEDNKNQKIFLEQIKQYLQDKFETQYLDVRKPDWINFFWSGEVTNNDTTFTFNYLPGRKDYVLWWMFQEWYITHAELINAFVEWIWYEFAPRYTYSIDAPHFVFFVRDFILQSSQFEWLDLSLNEILKWWYTIWTTLDSKKQEAAEVAALQTRDQLIRDGASSRAMLHVDSTNGGVLAYLWSVDYYDSDVDGQFDIIHALRQQWSTLKPFIYSRLLQRFPIGIDGYIMDAWYDTWPWPKPNNADGWFLGRMTISSALNNSRNLTAVRAYLANGGEKKMKPFFKSLWLTSISDERPYGYTLSLGAAEETMFNLAQAYLQLSTPHDHVPHVNPINSIIDKNWTVVYQRWKKHHERIIPKGIAYQIRNAMKRHTEVSNFWRQFVTYEWIGEYAIKSGTSDVKIDGVPYAKDGHLVIYNPENTIVSWWWNLDSKPLANNMLWSLLNKPFIDSYIAELATWSLVSTIQYDAPNDLEPNWIYKDPEFTEVPLEVQEVLWRR